MVQVKGNKLIITIKTNSPIDTMVNYQKALIDALKNYNADGTDGMTPYFMTEMLEEMLPTEDQNRMLYGK